MPFTFADCADPMLRVPMMQGTVAAALLTLGLVRPSEDGSRGALWRAVRDWGWVEHPLPGRQLLRVRRIGLKARARRGDGSLMIGVELEGAYWRVACDAMAEAERGSLGGPSGPLAVALGEGRLRSALLFRASGVEPSDWAAGRPLGASRRKAGGLSVYEMDPAPLRAGAPV